MNQAGEERRYVRAVEAAWAKLLGRPSLVSPREFATIDAWRRRGIPIAVVLEVIAAASKRRSGHAPKSLTGLAHTVDEAFAVVQSGRTTRGETDALPNRGAARSAWELALARSPSGTPLHALLSGLLEREREGAGAAELDADLDAALPNATPDHLAAQSKQDVAAALAQFRGRMSDDEYLRTSARALVDRLRLALALPRLSLTG